MLLQIFITEEMLIILLIFNFLLLTDAPKLTSTSSPITTVTGNSIILTCNVDANPSITDFYWRKSGSNISSSSHPEKYSGGTSTNTNLTIINTSKTDTGNYTCVAINSIGTSSSQPVTVVVNCKYYMKPSIDS